MKILQLNNRIPYPLNDGGNLGVYHFTEGFLDNGVELSLLAMNTSRHYVDVQQLPEIFNRLKHFQAIAVDTRIKPLDAFKNLFTQDSYNISRFISKHYEEKLIALLQNNQFDIIQLEGLYLTPYVSIIRKYSTAKIAIRLHNIEYMIWERLAKNASGLLKKKYLHLLTQRLKAFELQHINDYDIVLPISQQDAQVYQQLGCKLPLHIVPFGINTNHITYQPYQPETPISLYHLGAMDWLPNQESVHWFLEKVWPILQAKKCNVPLYLAGRNMPSSFNAYASPNVHIVGEVADATQFESNKSILIVPLQSGGGVRIKIFNAMAAGKAIVTTSVGVEGIAVTDEVLIADTPEAFAEAIIQLANQPERIKKMGENAHQLIKEKYLRSTIIKDLLNEYQKLISA